MSRLIKDQLVGLDPRFRYRGLNQTRVETFSDAVFALAITLVVLSSSVPETFTELRASMADVIPFLLCVILLVIIWVQHYFFFLSYGLQDLRTIVYNMFLLFLVLVYVYPLKFLMRFLVQFYSGLFVDNDSFFENTFSERPVQDMHFLMMVYGLGAALIFFTLAMMYLHAYCRRLKLDLNDYEKQMTRISIRTNVLLGGIPTLSFLISVIFGPHGWVMAVSGFTYMLYPIIMPTYGTLARKKLKKKFG